jgi:Transcriptional regulator PadR-like family
MGKPSDLVQGTLDLLILKTLSLEAKHGWAIGKRIQQVSKDTLQVQQGSLYPGCTASSGKAGSKRTGGRLTPDARRSSTH